MLELLIISRDYPVVVNLTRQLYNDFTNNINVSVQNMKLLDIFQKVKNLIKNKLSKLI